MNSPPLTTWSGLGPLNSLMTMVMSEIMSRVGTKIQNVRIRMKIFLSKSAMSDASEGMVDGLDAFIQQKFIQT